MVEVSISDPRRDAEESDGTAIGSSPILAALNKGGPQRLIVCPTELRVRPQSGETARLAKRSSAQLAVRSCVESKISVIGGSGWLKSTWGGKILLHSSLNQMS